MAFERAKIWADRRAVGKAYPWKGLPCRSQIMKQILKKIFSYLPFTITKNQRYDVQTRRVIQAVCQTNSACVDVGCHKGEILDLILDAAPVGTHYGFEPIPSLYEGLKRKYQSQPNCIISDIALSNEPGYASFNYVVSNPSYSGLKKRQYDRPNEQDTLITVQTDLLDSVLPENQKIDLIKIDVEGAEALVLAGARRTLGRYRPVIIFEFGLGASDVYGSKPEQLFYFFQEVGYGINLLCRFLDRKPPLTLQQFSEEYYQKRNHYFIAAPR